MVGRQVLERAYHRRLPSPVLAPFDADAEVADDQERGGPAWSAVGCVRSVMS
jgi:hypothetical protein